MQIAVITGEASGDRVGGQLVHEIKKLRPDAQIWGVGGKYLREAGAEVIVDATRWGVIGLASGLAVLPKVLHAQRTLHRELLRRRPDVVIPIDAGAFNVGFIGLTGLCPWLRKYLPKTRILYYFPPGSWRRTLKATPLAELTDVVATPFPWSETELRRLGVNAHFVGHPLLDLVHPEQDTVTFANRWGIDASRPIVGILPGSRAGEIEHVLPAQLGAAARIHARVPGTQFVIALAPTVSEAQILAKIEQERLERQRRQHAHETKPKSGESLGGQTPIPVPVEGGHSPRGADLAKQRDEWLRRAGDVTLGVPGDFPVVIVPDATYAVMAACDALLITSGTATLEAAILGKPMVIAYRMSERNRLEYNFVKKRMPRFIGMPNLLAEREICPEFVQEAATPDALADAIIGLLLEPDRLMQMREDLHTTIAQLGSPGGAARTAQMVVDLAEGHQA